MRARALLGALLLAALAAGAAAQRGSAATAAASAAVAVAGGLGNAAAPAASAVPFGDRRPARLGAPPVRLSFTAAFRGLSEADLAQNGNSEVFLPALLAAVAAAAGGPGVAVSVADVANVAPSGANWGALHVRLAVTFPPGARPGAFVDALNGARSDGVRILGPSFAPYGPVTLCCIGVGDPPASPPPAASGAGAALASKGGPLVLRLTRPPPAPPPQAAAVAFDTGRLSLLPFFAPSLPPSPPPPASSPPPKPPPPPAPVPSPPLLLERPDVVPIRVPARGGALGPASGPSGARALPAAVAPGANATVPPGVPGAVPAGTIPGATTGALGAVAAVPSPSPTPSPSPSPVVVASPPPVLPPPVQLLDRPVPAVPVPVPAAPVGPPLGGQPQPQLPLGGQPGGAQSTTPGFVVPGGATTLPGQQAVPQGQLPGRPPLQQQQTTPAAQVAGGVDTSKCSVTAIQSNFQAILVGLAPCISDASDACCTSVLKLIGPQGQYPNCLCEPNVFKGITTLDVSAVIPGVKVDILARLNACKAKNAAPPFIGGGGCTLR